LSITGLDHQLNARMKGISRILHEKRRWKIPYVPMVTLKGQLLLRGLRTGI